MINCLENQESYKLVLESPVSGFHNKTRSEAGLQEFL